MESITINQTTKQPNNQTTKQPNNPTTKQPDTKQLNKSGTLRPARRAHNKSTQQEHTTKTTKTTLLWKEKYIFGQRIIWLTRLSMYGMTDCIFTRLMTGMQV